MKKIKEHFLPIVLAALAAIFLFTTGWQKHQLHPLKPVAAELLPVFSIKDRGVAIFARAITADESKRYFWSRFSESGSATTSTDDSKQHL